jgi:acyl transferase domain-containing protein
VTTQFPPDISQAVQRPINVAMTQRKDEVPRLLVWSAADKTGVHRLADGVRTWIETRFATESSRLPYVLDDLAHTLTNHRSHLQWRSFSLARNQNDLSSSRSDMSPPVHVAPGLPRLGFVFTGQGAQWYAMGRELLCYPSFHTELQEAENYLRSIGCSWSIKGKLSDAD